MLQPTTVRKIIKELTQLRNDPPEDIRVQVDEEDVLQFVGIIAGPEGTPYHGGWFRVRFTFGDEFPASPPKCRFTTRIFHPNVSSSGEICVNTLKKDWKATYGITHILTVIKCLLIYPNPESALDEEAGKMLLDDYAGFAKRAKLMTEVHAARGGKPAEFEDAKEEEEGDLLFNSEQLFSPFADPVPSTSRPRVARPKARQASQPPSTATQSPTVATVTLPASNSTTAASTTVPISSSGTTLAAPLQVSAHSNGAPPRSSPAPEKEGANAVDAAKKAATGKEQSTKGKDAVRTTGVGKALKRPASAVSGGVKVEGGEKKKKGLKRL